MSQRLPLLAHQGLQGLEPTVASDARVLLTGPNQSSRRSNAALRSLPHHIHAPRQAAQV